MRVRLAPRTRVLDGGRLLVGGAPLTVQRLRRPVTEADSGTALGSRWLASGIGVPDLDDVPPVAADDLTVVVPTRDHPVDPAMFAPLRVVVVDDGSRVPVPGAVRRDVNGGPAAARNTGLAEVRTPYVALVDADVTATAADLLALARNLALPDVVMAGPRVRGRAAGRRWWERYDAAFSALDLGGRPAPVRPGSAVGYLPSACLVARVDALGDGFDPALRVGEDVDLVWRLVAAGHQVRYDPTVVVHHDTRRTFTAWLRQPFDYGTSAAPLAARHGTAVAPAVLRPTLGLAAAALLLRRRWSAPVALGVWAVATRRLRGTLPLPAAARVAGAGLGSAVQQEASLVVRHWWPLAALAALTPAGRRLVVSSALVDAAIALSDRRGLDPVTRIAGRRLTDLAYGAGVWRGCLRDRSAAALRLSSGNATGREQGRAAPSARRG